MKYLVPFVLMILNCQSFNETGFKSLSGNESFGFHLDPADKGSNPMRPAPSSSQIPDSNSYQQTQAQPPPQTLPTTLSRVIDTKYGKVQGLSLTLFPSYQGKSSANPLRNKIVEVFLSIPYASPPVKSHRFSPTQTPVPWDGIRTAVKPGFVCPQVMPDIRDESAALKEMPRGYLDYLRRVEPYLRNQSEDCLYLNIFSPVGSEPKLKLKPVLVFIHGGKFSWGSGNLYDGTLLSAYADLLFVTINYRLGVLGFLNVNPSPLTTHRISNFGLMDQIAALHYLKENIVYFGGDPENITLMGYEAGAACIHFLMSSPAVMSGLFHRAILIAGSAHAPWALVEDPAAVANSLAESLNCSMSPSSATTAQQSNISSSSSSGSSSNSFPRDSQHGGKSMHHSSSSVPSDPLLDCLKNKHFSYFSKFYPPKFAVDFGPSIDGVVIRPNFKATSTIEQQMGKRDLSRKYDLLFGISSLEMLTVFSEADLSSGFEFPRRDAILRTLIRNSYRFHLNEILATITNEYVDWERSVQHPISTRDLTLSAVTDCMSLAPVISASDSSMIRKSYFYVFEHTTKEGLYNYQQKAGAGGGEELNYLFGYPLLEHGVPFYPQPLPSNYTKAEMALSELLITHLSNFVHTGDPNEPIKSEGTWPISKERNKFRTTVWEPYDRLHQKYLELTANKVRVRSHFRAHQMAIWLRLVPELQRSGAQYASIIHNRMKGGNDASLYVGSLRLPQEFDPSLDPHSVEGEIGGDYNGTPPSPPTTCYSPLSSLASESASRAAAAAPVLIDGLSTARNDTGSGSSVFSPYTTALSLTIAIGCSLLILNVFIFALVYYQRDKRRAEEGLRRRRRDEELPGPAEDDELRNYGEPPELLKSSLTTATSFHQAQQQQHQAHGMSGTSEESGSSPGPSQDYGPNDSRPGESTARPPHKEVHFSPRPPNHAFHHHRQPGPSANQSNVTSAQQVLGIATLPRLHPEPENGTARLAGSNANNVGATLPRKPTPPTRNLTNYTITQRQIFSLIMSLMTMGLL